MCLGWKFKNFFRKIKKVGRKIGYEKNNFRNYSFLNNKFWLECVYFERKCSGNAFKKRSEAKYN